MRGVLFKRLTTLAHVNCPVCSKLTPVLTFNFDRPIDDIQIVTFRGRGRGQGFEVASRRSILYDNPTVRTLGNRAVAVISLLIRHGIFTEEYVLGKLGVTAPEPEPTVVTRVVHDAELEEAAEEAERKIFDAMDLDYDDIDENEDIAVRLGRAVNRIVRDYLEFRDVTGT